MLQKKKKKKKISIESNVFDDIVCEAEYVYKRDSGNGGAIALAISGAIFAIIVVAAVVQYRRKRDATPEIYGKRDDVRQNEVQLEMTNSTHSSTSVGTSEAGNSNKFFLAAKEKSIAQQQDLCLQIKSILDTTCRKNLSRGPSAQSLSSSSSSGSIQKTARGNAVSPGGGFYRKVLVNQISHNELTFDREFAHGAFGQVFIASYNGKKVAAKSPLIYQGNRDDAQRFADEILVLARLNHPPNCAILGACVDKPPMLLVCEFAPFGDLRTALKKDTLPRTFSLRLKKYCKMLRPRSHFCIAKIQWSSTATSKEQTCCCTRGTEQSCAILGNQEKIWR